MSARPEMFRNTGALVFGSVTVVACLALAVLVAVHPDAGAPAWLSAALVLFAAVVYVAQVRPAVVLDDSHLVLRNMLASVRVPWRMVGEVRVRQFLTVEVGEDSYDCAAVGRSRRQIYKDRKESLTGPGGDLSFGGFVETKIRDRAADAKRTPAEPDDAVQVVRAWPEIAVLAGAALALVVLLLG